MTIEEFNDKYVIKEFVCGIQELELFDLEDDLVLMGYTDTLESELILVEDKRGLVLHQFESKDELYTWIKGLKLRGE